MAQADTGPVSRVDIPASAHGHIGCCCCLNLTGKRVPAVTLIRGYAVCEDHVALASAPDFDIHALRSKRPGPV